MNAQQLKNAILQEAIEGRLVPQDPNDEPASVLLARIRKEKERLVKEGKLKKKDLEAKPISEDEIPFEIPKSWEWVRLNDIAEIKSSKRVFEKDYVTTGTPFFRSKEIGDLSRGEHIHTELYITQDHYSDLKEKYGVPQKGDILLTSVGSIGNFWISDGREFYYKDGNVTQICSNGNFDSRYITLFLGSKLFSIQTNTSVSGTAYNALTIIKLKSLLFPLPPLAEQKRIVAKIEELLPKVEKYGKAQDELNRLNEELPEKLKKSILQEAIEGRLVPQDPNDEPESVLLEKFREEKKQLVKEGKLKKKDLEEKPISEDEIPFEIPESWEWCKLGWIGNWGAGATPAKGNPDYYNNGTIPWLRTGELNNGYVYDSEIKVTNKALEKCSLRMCQKGDVLIAMYGATIGKVAIAGIELTTNQACCACTPYLIYNKYLLYYLLASKKTFTEMGEGGAQPNISREKIVAFPFALPPLAEQHRFVAKIEQLLSEIDKLKQ